MADRSSPSTPPLRGPAYDNDSDTSGLSSPPSDLSPLASKQTTQQPTSPKSFSIPPGYRINSITGEIMVDPKSRDHVANFRAMHHLDTDFSSGQYIDPRAYAVSMRHVPPNVPREERPYFAPLGPATKDDVDRYREPKKVERRSKVDENEVSEPMFVKPERGGGTQRKYSFQEDESWQASLARTPRGKRKRTDGADEEHGGKEDENGDTTLTDPGVPITPPVRHFRVG